MVLRLGLVLGVQVLTELYYLGVIEVAQRSRLRYEWYQCVCVAHLGIVGMPRDRRRVCRDWH
uniref:Putative ovule protein n=1 Tax=Solanum chacoense TaxID=4108 RepID=A0A0V0GI67_SOLCH